MVLIYNKSKIYIDKRQSERDTTLCKCDCVFDAIAFAKDNVWVFQVREVGYKHKCIFFGVYSIHKKAAIAQNI